MITIDNEKGYDIVKTTTLNWIVKYKYADKREGFYIYYIYVSGKQTMFFFEPDEKILTLSKIYGDTQFSFYVENFNDASKLVESFAKANGEDFKNTIYLD